jgi:hypothetical protein
MSSSSFQAPSAACVSGITSINNTACGGNNAASAMAPPPAKPALHEPPQLPRSAASANKSESFSSFFFHLLSFHSVLHKQAS